MDTNVTEGETDTKPHEAAQTEQRTILISMALSFASAVVVMIIFGYFVAHTGRDWIGESVPWWGALGDSLAPVSGTLSALALGAAIASVILQTRELAAQRDEMRQARIAQQELARDQQVAIGIARSQVEATTKLALAQERANALAMVGHRSRVVESMIEIEELSHAIAGAAAVEFVTADEERPHHVDPSARVILRRFRRHAETLRSLDATLEGARLHEPGGD